MKPFWVIILLLTLLTISLSLVAEEKHIYIAENEKKSKVTKEVKKNDLVKKLTLIDLETNLMWHKDKSKKKLIWNKAKKYCSDSMVANYADWRMPTRNEYINLLGGCPKNVLDGDSDACNSCSEKNGKCIKMFSEDTATYWTFTEKALKNQSSPIPEASWYVNFYNGYISIGTKISYHNVRCIRNIK